MPNWFIVLLCLCLAACAGTHRKPRPELPPNERAAEELSALYNDFRAAMAAKNFDTAEEMLEELEWGVKEADRTTIMHWKYPRILEGATRGRRMLEQARRTYAVDSISGGAQARLERGQALIDELAARGPSEPRLAKVDEVIMALQSLAERGHAYDDDQQLAALLPAIKEMVLALKRTRRQNGWLLALNARLQQVLAPAATPAPIDRTAALDHAEAARDAARACQRMISEARKQPGHQADLLIALPFGRFTVPDAQRVCAAEESRAAGRWADLRWHGDVQEIATWVSEALVAIEEQKDAAEILGANERAVQTLIACEDRLRDTESDPGYVAGMTFASHVGQMSAPRLRQSCEKVRLRLETAQGQLRWRRDSDRLKEWIDGVRSRAKALPKKTSRKDAPALADIVAQFAECVERANALATLGDPVWQGARPNPQERQAMTSLAEMCGKERAFFANRK